MNSSSFYTDPSGFSGRYLATVAGINLYLPTNDEPGWMLFLDRRDGGNLLWTDGTDRFSLYLRDAGCTPAEVAEVNAFVRTYIEMMS